MFPFLEKVKTAEESKLLEQMKKEVSKGPLQFSEVVMRPLRSQVKKMMVPDDFKQKLQNKAYRRRLD